MILAVSLFSGSIYASHDDDEPHDPITLKLETADFKPTPRILRSALIRALLNYNWEIKTIEKNKINAEYRNEILMVKFIDELVVELTLESKIGDSPNEKWLRNIKKFIMKELKYHYYIQQFNIQSNTGSD